MPPTELRVFVSSTFRDLFQERAHLAQRIFPEIRTLCRERGVVFTEVDLRWGLTEELVSNGQVLRTCLEEIDRCRPYFIGILGESYGYVPDLTEIYKDPELLRRYPWIEQAALDGTSIMELEVRHGVLNDPERARTHSRFFARRPRQDLGTGADEYEQQRLDELERRLRHAGIELREFHDPHSLGAAVYQELCSLILRDFGDAEPLSPLERDRSRHRAFASSRSLAYIPNLEYLRRLDHWLSEDSPPPIVVSAGSGAGKSALVSFWCRQLTERRPDLTTIEYYVGIGSDCEDHIAVMRYVMSELRERFAPDAEIPSTAAEISTQFVNWLGYARREPVLIVIDGANGLGDRNLSWLPASLPAGVHLAITSSDERMVEELRTKGWLVQQVQPLTEREREAVTVRFLAEYSKALPSEHVRAIASCPRCAQPLFLRTLLEELRVEARHGTLERQLHHYLAAPTTEDLFQLVIERIEEDFGHHDVHQVMTLLWASRFGLGEPELTELTDVSRLSLAAMVGGLDYHLVRNSGLLNFFHEYLRGAVERRYLGDGTVLRAIRQKLASWFSRDDSARGTRELIHQFAELGDVALLRESVTSVPRMLKLWESGAGHELLLAWSDVSRDSFGEAVGAALARWIDETAPSTATYLDAIETMYAYCSHAGAIGRALELAHTAVQISRDENDSVHLSRAMINRATSLIRLGRGFDAAVAAEDAVSIARDLSDVELLRSALTALGSAHLLNADSTRAADCAREVEALARASGSPRGILASLRFRLQFAWGDPEERLRITDEICSLARVIGDVANEVSALVNRAGALAQLGTMERAEDACRRAEGLARSNGLRSLLAEVLVSHAAMLNNVDRFEQSLQLLDEVDRIAEDTGYRGVLGFARMTRGYALRWLGRLDAAKRALAEAEHFMRESNDRLHLADLLADRADLLANLEDDGDADCAAEDVERERREARRLLIELLHIPLQANQHGVTDPSIQIARLDFHLGDPAAARERLHALLVSSDAVASGTAHYWLWKLFLDAEVDHRAAALRLLGPERRPPLDCRHPLREEWARAIERYLAEMETAAPTSDELR